ncbi:hypothetical protein O3P69_016414 [Scylla paramamosain]|uniref:Uncharacterized protein n=1 Tax=Scylla paramamosain TaxID=85552 RepID=A0AAW0TD58_SCYPA
MPGILEFARIALQKAEGVIILSTPLRDRDSKQLRTPTYLLVVKLASTESPSPPPGELVNRQSVTTEQEEGAAPLEADSERSPPAASAAGHEVNNMRLRRRRSLVYREVSGGERRRLGGAAPGAGPAAPPGRRCPPLRCKGTSAWRRGGGGRRRLALSDVTRGSGHHSHQHPRQRLPHLIVTPDAASGSRRGTHERPVAASAALKRRDILQTLNECPVGGWGEGAECSTCAWDGPRCAVAAARLRMSTSEQHFA